MEAATKERQLSGEKAQRIVDAMRDSVARRGAAGSTFEHVAREAGVSRGLLHYYFGTKERLLVEVVRRDSELRIARLDEMLAEAKTADDVLDVLVSSLTDLIENDPGFFLLLYELFSAGRRNPDIQHEVGQLFEATRSHVANVLRAKEDEGILCLRFDAEAVVAYLLAVADGFALQSLSDPSRDITPALNAGAAAPATSSSPTDPLTEPEAEYRAEPPAAIRARLSTQEDANPPREDHRDATGTRPRSMAASVPRSDRFSLRARRTL